VWSSKLNQPVIATKNRRKFQMAGRRGPVQKRIHTHHLLRQIQRNSMTNIFQSLLLVIAGATQKELARQVKYLKVENQDSPLKLPKRIMVTPKEPTRLIKFGQKLGGKVLRQLTTIVAPETILGWIRAEKRPKPQKRKRGRPNTPEQIRQFILLMARENQVATPRLWASRRSSASSHRAATR
jgi:hypothetical protein